jgi:haloacetate dehalogenase
MFPDFEERRITTPEAEINLRIGGSGPPVFLLHGYPQSHVMWHAVAPRLAERFTVVCPDLRGYGDSSHPPDGENHEGYCKRSMARDQVAVMDALGFETFALVGHDRGGRVAHRLTTDNSERVSRLVILDIVPTLDVFRATNQAIATSTYHWFFLIQPDGLPERMIGADPGYYLRECLRRWSGGRDDFFHPEAMAEYERCFSNPATIHASCEDYRAGASIDLEHDEADLERTFDIPLLVVWGDKSKLPSAFDVVGTWRSRFPDVRGKPLPSGHFLPEEVPDETAEALLAFLGEGL